MSIIILFIRYAFLALLYLFVIRVVRIIYLDLTKSEATWNLPEVSLDYAEAGLSQKEKLAELVVISAPPDIPFREGETISLGRQVSIGRGRENDIMIKDGFTSHQHAKIYLRQGQFWIEDSGSLNGTFVNGVAIDHPVVLAQGDVVRVGEVTFQFVRWKHAG